MIWRKYPKKVATVRTVHVDLEPGNDNVRTPPESVRV
jgi:hypothetical protein